MSEHRGCTSMDLVHLLVSCVLKYQNSPGELIRGSHLTNLCVMKCFSCGEQNKNTCAFNFRSGNMQKSFHVHGNCIFTLHRVSLQSYCWVTGLSNWICLGMTTYFRRGVERARGTAGHVWQTFILRLIDFFVVFSLLFM